MFPFEKEFLAIGEPMFDDPTKTIPDFGKALEAVAAAQGISFEETGLYPPSCFLDSTEPHFEYRLFKGKTASSEYEPIQFDYFPTESTLRVYSNIPESKAMPVVTFIADKYLGILLEEKKDTIKENMVLFQSMTPCIKRFELIVDMLSEAITNCIEKGDYDIQNKWWMKNCLELLAQRPKSPDKTQKGPMRIGFDYPDSVRIATAARKLYESLYAWISECHPEQFDTYHRDYNSLAGQTLDIFENLSTEEDWVYCLFTLNESPRGEKYNIYNPKPFSNLYDICMKLTPTKSTASPLKATDDKWQTETLKPSEKKKKTAGIVISKSYPFIKSASPKEGSIVMDVYDNKDRCVSAHQFHITNELQWIVIQQIISSDEPCKLDNSELKGQNISQIFKKGSAQDGHKFYQYMRVSKQGQHSKWHIEQKAQKNKR